MRNLRRYYLANAEYFITIATHNRVPLFLNPGNIDLLKEAFRQTIVRTPFSMRAFVFLPDHLHTLIRPRARAEDISMIVGITKRTFTKSFYGINPSKKGTKLWQSRFYDHIIRDNVDLKRHLDYIHFNPVKHGLVARPEEYSHSSFSKFLAESEYEIGWGHVEPKKIAGMELQIEPLFFRPQR